MYIIFNKDGSVSESQLTDYINQHSDGVNYIDVSIVGKSVDEYTADGNFKLPNDDVVSLVGAFTNKIKTSTGVYEGYRITLSAVVTEYQGDVALSIQAYNSDKTTLFTYPVTLYVNETTGRGGDPITQDQYEALRAMMADYQLQYARSNMRSYDTLAEAEEDLPNLSEGQMILAKENAESETSSVFQKVGDKLEGVSLDGLAVDKFLRNRNAQGTGTFTWTDETEGGNVDFQVRSTTSKDGQETFDFPKTDYVMKVFGNAYGANAEVEIQGMSGFDGESPKLSLRDLSSGESVFTPNSFQSLWSGVGKITWLKGPTYCQGDGYFVTSHLLGKANGVATLNANGKIPNSQLSSYVSDVIEYPTFNDFPTLENPGYDEHGIPIYPEDNKIYIALDTNKTYRWGGTVYVEIGSSLALGETSETAYAGDKGKANADNITALQSGKLDKKDSGVPYGFAFYAMRSEGPTTAPTDYTLLATQHPTADLQIPMTDTDGRLYGRANQTTIVPEDNELITKAYGDKEYKSVVTIELTDSQVASIQQGKIAFTQEQFDAMKADGVTSAMLMYKGTQLYRFFISKTPFNNKTWYTIFAIGTQVGDSTYSNIMFLGGDDLTKENTAFVSPLCSQYVTSVSIGQGQLSITTDEDMGKTLIFDNINGKAIAHDSDDSPSSHSYYAPETINNTATAKVLTSKSGAFEWSDLSEAGTSVTIRRW